MALGSVGYAASGRQAQGNVWSIHVPYFDRYSLLLLAAVSLCVLAGLRSLR
jgi:hypothetical protein